MNLSHRVTHDAHHSFRSSNGGGLQGLGSCIATTLRGFDVTTSAVDVAVAATSEALRPIIAVAGSGGQRQRENLNA